MSNPNKQRQALAEAFGRELDPLAEFAETFNSTEIDPFEIFRSEVLESRDLANSTMDGYDRSWKHYREYMENVGRHPACPSEEHVRGWVQYERDERGNVPDTVRWKLRLVNAAYEYWQADPSFPHPQDYNPFELAREKEELNGSSVKEPHRIDLDTLGDVIRDITHIRDRAIVTTQLKLALRAHEVCNIKLSDITIANRELNEHYPELGTHPLLRDYENAIYIPPNPRNGFGVEGREGNKSRCPRILPLGDELRSLFLQYLLIRPDNGAAWMFLSKTQHEQLVRNTINDIWAEHFRPQYAETDHHRPVTSHYGRHRFTTYWRIEQDVNRELIKYMRGDVGDRKDTIDEYIHTYYKDIEPLYRENIFKLRI